MTPTPTNFFFEGEERIGFAIDLLSAMDAWEIGMISKDIVKSEDHAKRRAFANRLLKTVTVTRGEYSETLSTEDATDRQLKTGTTVDFVVNEVLKANGLDTLELLETRVDPWSDTGARMAISFLTEATRLSKLTMAS